MFPRKHTLHHDSTVAQYSMIKGNAGVCPSGQHPI